MKQKNKKNIKKDFTVSDILPEPAAPPMSHLYVGKGYIEGRAERAFFLCVHFKNHSVKKVCMTTLEDPDMFKGEKWAILQIPYINLTLYQSSFKNLSPLITRSHSNSGMEFRSVAITLAVRARKQKAALVKPRWGNEPLWWSI